MKFKVGQVCVTQGSRWPLLNDGLTVVVIGINPQATDHRGLPTPYWVRRIDGQRFASTLCPQSGARRFYAGTVSWVAEHRLRSFDEGQQPPAQAKRTRKASTKQAVAA